MVLHGFVQDVSGDPLMVGHDLKEIRAGGGDVFRRCHVPRGDLCDLDVSLCTTKELLGPQKGDGPQRDDDRKCLVCSKQLGGGGGL